MSLVITLKDTEFTNPNLPVIPLDYPMEGIAALYRMDTVVNGLLVDSSGNNHHAVLDNNYAITPEGLRLDDGFAQSPISIVQDDLTIFAVHKIDKVPLGETEMSRYRFVWSYYDGSTNYQDQLYYTPVDSELKFGPLKQKNAHISGALAEEKWVFTCVSWGAGRYKYISPQFGVSADVVLTSMPSKPVGIGFNIGQIGEQQLGAPLKYHPFNGTMGVVGVYKSAMTIAQMQNIYKAAQIQMAKRGIVI